MENEIYYRKGYTAALEWVLNAKPSKNEIKGKIKYNRMLLEE